MGPTLRDQSAKGCLRSLEGECWIDREMSFGPAILTPVLVRSILPRPVRSAGRTVDHHQSERFGDRTLAILHAFGV
jgi:hypothetical protein